jgi:hypothetical protein
MLIFNSQVDHAGNEVRNEQVIPIGDLSPQLRGPGCTLATKTIKQCVQVGECATDFGGSYLVASESKVHEYVIRQSEYFTCNRVRVRDGSAVVLSYPARATDRRFEELAVCIDAKTRIIHVRRSPLAKALPILLVFRAFGIRSQAAMRKLFSDHS